MTTPLPKKRQRVDNDDDHPNQEERQQLLEKIRRLEDENAGQKQRIDELERTIEHLQQQKDKKEEEEQKALMAKAEELLLKGNSKKRPISREELLRLPERLSPYEVFSDLVLSVEQISTWDATVAWFRRVESALESYPFLAHIGYPVQTGETKRLDLFLLGMACKLMGERFDVYADSTRPFPLEDFFQKLIAANPRALLWKCDDHLYDEQTMCIMEMAGGLRVATYHIFLMVAREFGWIFDLPELLSSNNSPHAELLYQYIVGDVDYEVIEAFYRSQPQLLNVDEDGQYPIHQILKHVLITSDDVRRGSSLEPLVKFMVQQFPESLQIQDGKGRLPLHHVLSSLNSIFNDEDHVDPSFADINTLICIDAVGILIDRYPKALLVKDKQGQVPLDMIQAGFDQAEVNDIVTAMLRLYFPQSLTETMKAIPFYQNAYLLLQEEAAFASNFVRIKRVDKMIQKYTSSPTDPSADSENDSRAEINQIYSSWAMTNLAAASVKMRSIRANANRGGQ